MTNWQPNLAERKGPRYLAIADALCEDITRGTLEPGERLPTHRDLAWDLKLTVGTVSRAYAAVERRGLIRGEVGRGTYVRNAPAAEKLLMTPIAADESAVIDLNFAFPPPSGEEHRLGPTLEAIARDQDPALLLDYQPRAGLDHHRAAGAAWLAKSGVEVPPERVVLTAGAQHAITVCLATLTRPGDRVLCEALTYPGIQTIARLLGLRLEGLPADEFGIIPDALEAACRMSDVKALYCVPTIQNPTTLTMPETRRREIAAVARKAALPVIEDDIFGLFADERPPAIRNFLPEQGYFLTSVSKTIAPGLRVGYVTGPKLAEQRLTAAVRATCWMTPPLTTEIASRWIFDGTAERILEARRGEAATRRALALGILGRWNPACPPGAIYLWLRLPEPWRSSDFALEAQRRGVAIAPAEACAIGRTDVTPAIRISFGPPRDTAALETGLRRLDQLLEAGPAETFGQAL